MIAGEMTISNAMPRITADVKKTCSRIANPNTAPGMIKKKNSAMLRPPSWSPLFPSARNITQKTASTMHSIPAMLQNAMFTFELSIDWPITAQTRATRSNAQWRGTRGTQSHQKFRWRVCCLQTLQCWCSSRWRTTCRTTHKGVHRLTCTCFLDRSQVR